MPTRGTVRDIRTGRSIRRTDSMEDVFVDQLISLKHAGVEHYVVKGPCRHLDSRIMADMLIDHGIKVIHDRQFKPDTFWIFSGKPEELGFKVA